MQFTQWLNLCEFVLGPHPHKIRADRSTARNIVYLCSGTAGSGGNCPYCVKLQRHKDKSWKVTYVQEHGQGCTSVGVPSAKVLRILLGCANLRGASAKRVQELVDMHGFKFKGHKSKYSRVIKLATGQMSLSTPDGGVVQGDAGYDSNGDNEEDLPFNGAHTDACIDNVGRNGRLGRQEGRNGGRVSSRGSDGGDSADYGAGSGRIVAAPTEEVSSSYSTYGGESLPQSPSSRKSNKRAREPVEVEETLVVAAPEAIT